MNNPFIDLEVRSEVESEEDRDQKRAKRDAIYNQFDPMVSEILDMFIAAHRQGIWEKDSDCSRRYCCHVAWFAGPKEKYTDPYDQHHTIRRRIEVRLELDGLCNPTGFTVAHYGALERIMHVGLEKQELIRGIKAVMS